MDYNDVFAWWKPVKTIKITIFQSQTIKNLCFFMFLSIKCCYHSQPPRKAAFFSSAAEDRRPHVDHCQVPEDTGRRTHSFCGLWMIFWHFFCFSARDFLNGFWMVLVLRTSAGVFGFGCLRWEGLSSWELFHICLYFLCKSKVAFTNLPGRLVASFCLILRLFLLGLTACRFWEVGCSMFQVDELMIQWPPFFNGPYNQNQKAWPAVGRFCFPRS